jgi:hypothetical protein
MIKTSIIPEKLSFYGIKDSFDYEEICCFITTGFFLGSSTWYKGLKVYPPATLVSDSGKPSSWFEWEYKPRDISLKQATEEFADIFENIIKDKLKSKKVILPLSGGLDSRTLASAIRNLKNEVAAYSYHFKNGHNESNYGKEIAKLCGFKFNSFEIRPGYIWNIIDQIRSINDCYSEFTHPRQMANFNQYSKLGDIFCLGHWGDVLFNDMGIPDDLNSSQQLDVILKKITNPGGLELARTLWKDWGCEGSFDAYFKNRVKDLLSRIKINHSANARLRAFKSLYWAHRWTSVNLSFFKAAKPIILPYYNEKICRFICTVPEKLLRGRQIQIEYLKMNAPDLAKVVWEQNRPFNLYNYRYNKLPWNIPYRLKDKSIRVIKHLLGRKHIQRNWELQFLGQENQEKLKENLLSKNIVPEKTILKYLNLFMNENSEKYAHPISMLLAVSNIKLY